MVPLLGISVQCAGVGQLVSLFCPDFGKRDTAE